MNKKKGAQNRLSIKPVTTHYDLMMLLRNIGGNGGMCYVLGTFFDWGVIVMRIISTELTVADIERKGEKAVGRVNRIILSHASLKSDLMLIY